MTPNEYQKLTKETLQPTSDNLEYLTLGLVSEAGEVAGKVKKIIRGDYPFDEIRHMLAAEIGDVLWYCARAADFMGFSLEEIMRNNITKLQNRKNKGTIKGDGDER